MTSERMEVTDPARRLRVRGWDADAFASVQPELLASGLRWPEGPNDPF